MDKYYIDLSVQNSSVLLKNNYSVNLVKKNIENNSNLNNNGDLIEGFGNFGRVNLEKCCPLEYMWSENQKKCVKVCDGCAIGAYGNINYEFLTSNGEFMSFAQCVGDATGAYDFDKINKRYGIDELLTQHDLNHHIDSDENASGVQPAEENPWADVSSKVMYTSSTKQQTSIRNIGHYAADAREAYLQSIGQNTEYLDNRTLICSINELNSTISTEELTQAGQTTELTQEEEEEEEEQTTDPTQSEQPTEVTELTDPPSEDQSPYTLCNGNTPNPQDWNNLCGLEDSQYNSLDFTNICNEGNNNDIVNRLCDEDDRLTKNLICP